MGSSVTLPMLPQPAFPRRRRRSHRVGKAVSGVAFAGRFGVRFDVAKRGFRRRFGAQLVTKLTIFRAAIFVLKPLQTRNPPTKVPQPTPGIRQRLFTTRTCKAT